MRKILIILLLAVSLVAGAEQWHVATAANGGSDTDGDGSATHPWVTLKHAADTITGAGFAGDTITLGAGTFTEPTQVALSAGVSIYGTGATTIITSGAALNPIILLSSVAEGTNGNQSISYIQVDGNLTATSLIYVSARSNVKIHHCTFIDALTYGISFRGKTDNVAGAPDTFATGNEFYNNTVTNCAIYTGGNGYGNIEFAGQNGLKIYNNTITQTDRGGTEHGYGLKAVNNYGYNHGIKIYGNTITVPVYENAGFEFAIELWTSRGGIEIYDNTISGGIDLAGYDTNDSLNYGYAARVYGNDIGRSATQAVIGRGIVIESGGTAGISGGVYVYNNNFHHISNPIEISVGDAAGMTYSDIYIYYNIFNEIRKTTTYSGTVTVVNSVGVRTATFDNVQFLNNVIYASAVSYTSAGFFCGDPGHTWTNTVVRNNIFFNVYNAVKFESCTVTTINVDNNNFYGVTNSITYEDCTETGTTAANNITTDPLFQPLSNFRLQAESDCIDAGISVGLTRDYDNNVVGASPDIGAFEYTVLSPAPGKYVVKDGKYQMYNGKLVINPGL